MINVCVVFGFAWSFLVVDKTCSSARSSPFTVHKAFAMFCKMLCILPYGINIQKDHQQLLVTLCMRYEMEAKRYGLALL